SQDPRRMDRAELGSGHQAFGKGVANAATQRVDEVFLGMVVGREVDPPAAAALAAVALESDLQPQAPRVNQEVAGFQQYFERLEPVEDHVLRPASEEARAEHPLHGSPYQS